MKNYFETYADALLFCGGKGYGLPELVNVVIEKNLVFANSLRGINPPRLDLASIRTLLGLGLSDCGSNPIRVLDFGGGGGYHYNIARAALSSGRIIDWRVVETTEMACAAQNKLSNSELQFFDSIDSATQIQGKIDLVLASSSLQYCPDPIDVLQQLKNINANYMFITRTPFTSLEKNLVLVQKSMLRDNGPGLMPAHFNDRELLYPITLIPAREVKKILEGYYRIRFEIEEEGGHYVVNDQAITTQCGYFCEKI